MVHQSSICTTFSHLHTSHVTILQSHSKSSPPPNLACKTTGRECLGKRISNVCRYLWSNLIWVCANLGFIAHTLCHYCEIALSPQVTIYSAWIIAEYIQQNSLSYGIWSQGGVDSIVNPRQHNYGVVVWGFQKLFCSCCSSHADFSAPVLTS